ncbi:nucleotidyltransferase [bacterium]|nr:nucleotidyltransferase [bacterium]
MKISEETFVSWSKGPSETETKKCSNAENAIREAVKADRELLQLNPTVLSQGSYRARTNVRLNSDVDICIRYNNEFFPDYPQGTTAETFGNKDGTLKYADFKNIVQRALESYFGRGTVTRGNKAFDIHENTYRVDADVVATFEHRRYTGRKNPDGTHHYHSGTAFDTDKGVRIINWPQQNYDNGVKRNQETERSYKRVIRVFKRLRDKMQDDSIPGASGISSWLIECLIWNAKLEVFKEPTYSDKVKALIIDLWNRTKEDKDCSEWGEVNELKYLFRSSQPWTRQQVQDFLKAAWNYIGYK